MSNFQLTGLILLDSINQCNKAQLSKAEYKTKLKEMLDRRLNEEVDVNALLRALT